MKKQEFTRYLANDQFEDMFIELGWNDYSGDKLLYPADIDGKEFDFYVVAQQSGFMVLKCEVEWLPTAALYKKLDTQIRKSAHDYICIYYVPETAHQMWIVPVNKVDKRDLVSVKYHDEAHAEFLYDKVEGFTFEIGESTNIIDVKNRVQKSFIVNSEKLTKKFYDEFKKQHKAFEGFISGIESADDRRWYTSIMLDRLMFCYFIQKKGFLNANKNYLQDKLQEVREREGDDEFYAFYRDFLCQLFHDGLNKPRHETPEFLMKFGRIPYLNGGMFDVHTLERKYNNIQIKDDAFLRLFNFFDQWEWHLDTRISSSGRDINPDVLGYIFEQFINDRAQMGAYYTKEDITGYIGRNCIVPFLFDRMKEKMPKAFAHDGKVWQYLKQSADRYIYDAVKKGYTKDWRERLPENIAIGLDTSKPNLLERRKHWNEKTSDDFALPTEIWRETIERLERCERLIKKIANGEIESINDFITFNLDIRSFAYDVLANADDHNYVRHFYHALQRITILDPTCGSGAFLFAAMNILEPLYEICISRMQEFNKENSNLFRDEMDEINNKYRSNIQYFIYKSIILRNLYGVDIMAEAIEIAKLRLFLKMVAVVDVDMRAPNLGLDPLPDIDFNIRCGNTLVGYATEDQLENSINFGDMFARIEFKDKIQNKLNIVSKTYETFKWLQMNQQDDRDAFKEAKRQLAAKLASLNEDLNQHLYGHKPDLGYNSWLQRTQPFHWIAEFYEIMHNGGFDVIIGNPPYVEYRKKVKGVAVSDIYTLSNYKTIDCGNLYAYVIERGFSLANNNSYVSYIIPSASVCTPRMKPLSKMLYGQGLLWTSIWDERPSKLFDGVDQQLCIHISKKSNATQRYITRMTHWTTECRGLIFENISYIEYSESDFVAEVAPKIQDNVEKELIKNIYNSYTLLQNLINTTNANSFVYYKNAGGRYWKLVKSFPTYFNSSKSSTTTTEKTFKVPSEDVALTVTVLSSSLFYWYWRVCSNCRHLTNREIDNFPISKSLLIHHSCLDPLLKKYEDTLKTNKIRKITTNSNSGKIEQDFYFAKLSKTVIDEIDKVLAHYYGLTEEELDFIINYDIKYRMGEELSE